MTEYERGYAAALAEAVAIAESEPGFTPSTTIQDEDDSVIFGLAPSEARNEMERSADWLQRGPLLYRLRAVLLAAPAPSEPDDVTHGGRHASDAIPDDCPVCHPALDAPAPSEPVLRKVGPALFDASVTATSGRAVYLYPDRIVVDGEDLLVLEPRELYDPCIVGIVARFNDRFVLYDKAKILEILTAQGIEEGESPEDAEQGAIDHFEFNMNGGWYGPGTWGFLDTTEEVPGAASD